MSLLPVFAYVSPETFLPMTSVLTAVVGFFLMFGRTIARFVRDKVFGQGSRRGPTPPLTTPHFRRRTRTNALAGNLGARAESETAADAGERLI